MTTECYCCFTTFVPRDNRGGSQDGKRYCDRCKSHAVKKSCDAACDTSRHPRGFNRECQSCHENKLCGDFSDIAHPVCKACHVEANRRRRAEKEAVFRKIVELGTHVISFKCQGPCKKSRALSQFSRFTQMCVKEELLSDQRTAVCNNCFVSDEFVQCTGECGRMIQRKDCYNEQLCCRACRLLDNHQDRVEAVRTKYANGEQLRTSNFQLLAAEDQEKEQVEREARRKENSQAYSANRRQVFAKYTALFFADDNANGEESLLTFAKTRASQDEYHVLELAFKSYLKYDEPTNMYKYFTCIANRECRTVALSVDDVSALASQPCYTCGTRRVSGSRSYHIDRVDPLGNYTPSNVAPCCGTCNRIKANLRLCTFLSLCENVATAKQHYTFDPSESSMKILEKGSDKFVYQRDAKLKQVPFELSDELFHRITASECLTCKRKASPSKPNGINRLVLAQGFVENNIVPMCSLCSKSKGGLTVDGFKQHCAKVVAFVDLPVMAQRFKSATCHCANCIAAGNDNPPITVQLEETKTSTASAKPGDRAAINQRYREKRKAAYNKVTARLPGRELTEDALQALCETNVITHDEKKWALAIAKENTDRRKKDRLNAKSDKKKSKDQKSTQRRANNHKAYLEALASDLPHEQWSPMALAGEKRKLQVKSANALRKKQKKN